jgi:LPXTG-motif cell wall-anchored protein
MAVATIARRVLATGAIAGTALLAITLPASAHNGDVSASCENGKSVLHISLVNYNGQKDNSVKAVADGQTSLVDTNFKTSFDKSYSDLAADAPHTYVVTVKAWDSDDYSFTKNVNTPACVTPPPTTTTTTVAPTSSTTTPSSPVPTTTSPAATPPADQGGLANTGASVGLPLGIGALLLVGGGALLLVVRKRRSAA